DQQSLGGPSRVDIDNDGDLDLIIGTGTFNSTYLGLRNAVHVYRNDVGQDANWTRVRLIGKGAGASNRAGIGARVEVTAAGHTQYQEVLGSYGHSNTQTDTFLTFGLGAACEMDTIVVHWPDQSGRTTTYMHIQANSLVEITEGEPNVHYVPLSGSGG